MKLARFVFLMVFVSSFVFAHKISFEYLDDPNFDVIPPSFKLKIIYESPYDIFPGTEVLSSDLLSRGVTNALGEKNTSNYSNELLHNALFFLLIKKIKEVFNNLDNPGFETENFDYGNIGISDLSSAGGSIITAQTYDLENIDEENEELVLQRMAFELYRLLDDFRTLGGRSQITIVSVDEYKPDINNLIEYVDEVGENEIPVYVRPLPFYIRYMGPLIALGAIGITLVLKLVPYLKAMQLFEQRQ